MIGKFFRYTITCSSWSIQPNTTTAIKTNSYYEQRLKQNKKESIPINFHNVSLMLRDMEGQANKNVQVTQAEENQVESIRRNLLDGRVLHKQFSANSPVEDAMCSQQLKVIEGYLLAVFDGHGGNTLARFSSQNIVGYFEKAYSKWVKKPSPDPVVGALNQAYQTLEISSEQLVREEICKGNKRAKNMGTCALTVVVTDNTVYVANSGDSQGILIEMENEHVSHKSLNQKFNTSNPDEQQRLRKQFPSQQDILVRGKSCPAIYIKGRLQTTRSIGDFYLKKQEFNTSPRIKDFTGPYVTHEPDIKKFKLGPQSKYLVLGSDGLWDELNQLEVARLIMSNDQKDKAQMLVEECLKKIAHRNEMTTEQIESLPEKQKRNFHDDITVLVVDLQQQYSA